MYSTSPDISIIIPIRNCDSVFRETMESALAQNMQNYEVIIVNDRSTDTSRDIAEELKRLYGRVRIIDLSIHQGFGAARNLALHNALGQYVIFANAGDTFSPDMAQRAYECAKENDADIILFNSEPKAPDDVPSVGGTGVLKPDGYPASFDPREHADTLFEDLGLSLNSMALRREFLIESQVIFPTLERDDTLLFTCSALASAQQIALLNQKLYRHTLQKSDTPDSERSTLDFHESCRLLYAYLDYRGLFDTYRQTYANVVASHIMNGLLNAESERGFLRSYEFLHIRGLADLGFGDPDTLAPADGELARMMRVIIEYDIMSGMYQIWHYDIAETKKRLAPPQDSEENAPKKKGLFGFRKKSDK